MLIDNRTAQIFATEAMDSITSIEHMLHDAERLLPEDPPAHTLQVLADIQQGLERVKTAIRAQRSLTHPMVVLNSTIIHWMGKSDMVSMELIKVLETE